MQAEYIITLIIQKILSVLEIVILVELWLD